MKLKKNNKTALVLPKNIKKGEPVFYNSNWYSFQGFINGKPQLKRGYTDSMEAIKECNQAGYWIDE
jgi:hypothetical protein